VGVGSDHPTFPGRPRSRGITSHRKRLGRGNATLTAHIAVNVALPGSAVGNATESAS
jgi:hypothetical protein